MQHYSTKKLSGSHKIANGSELNPEKSSNHYTAMKRSKQALSLTYHKFGIYYFSYFLLHITMKYISSPTCHIYIRVLCVCVCVRMC